MQKKLLALVATVAVVLSMFAGIVFAADPIPVTITTSPAVTNGVLEQNPLAAITISTTAFDSQSSASAVVVYKPDGTFAFATVVTPAAVATSGEYTFTPSAYGTYRVELNHPGHVATPVSFRVVKDADEITVDVEPKQVTRPADATTKTVTLIMTNSAGPVSIAKDSFTVKNGATTLTPNEAGPANVYTVTVDKDTPLGTYKIESTDHILKPASFEVVGTLIPANIAIDKTTVKVNEFVIATITLADGTPVTGLTSSDLLVTGDGTANVAELGAGRYAIEAKTADKTYTVALNPNKYSAVARTFACNTSGAPVVTGAKIVFDKDVVARTDDDKLPITVIGKIVDASGAIINKHFELAVDDVVSSGGLAINGEFSMQLPGKTAPKKYTVTAYEYGTATVAATAFLTVADELTTDSTLGFTWGESGTFRYYGTLPVGITGTKLARLVDANGQQVSGSQVPVAGNAFIMELDKRAAFKCAGKLVLEYSKDNGANWIKLAQGKIKTVDISDVFSVSPDHVIYANPTVSQNVSFYVDDSDLFMGPTGATKQIRYSIVDADGDDYLAWSTATARTVAPVSGDRGKYTAQVEILVNGVAAYEGEADFFVDRPDNVMLTGLKSAIGMGGYKFTLGSDVTVIYYDKDAKAYKQADSYFVTASGAGLAGAITYNDPAYNTYDDGTAITLLPNKEGAIAVNIKGYDEDGKLIANMNRSIKVKAMTLTAAGSLTYNQAGELVFSLKNGEKPINTAYIYVVKENIRTSGSGNMTNRTNVINNPAAYAIAKVDPTKQNIDGGEYTLKLKATDTLVQKAGNYYAAAVLNGELVSVARIRVAGEEAYTVTVDAEQPLLAGQKEKVIVKVTDKDGKAVAPQGIWYYNEAGTDYNADSLACKKVTAGYEVVMPALLTEGTYTIEVDTDGGNKVGFAEIEVVKPVIEVDVEKVTDAVYSVFTFKLVDPRDNSVLDWNVRVNGQFVELNKVELLDELTESYDKVVWTENNNFTVGRQDEYTLKVLVNADYDAAAKEDKVPHLRFYVTNDAEVRAATNMNVGSASFTADPASVVVGKPSPVTLKLADANGAGLVGYEIYRGRVRVGETDENGELVYNVLTAGLELFSFDALLDLVDEKDVPYSLNLQVTPVYDDEKPTVVYEKEVDEPKTTIVIGDNIRLTRIRINGEDIDFFATNKHEYTANLKPGVNKFVIEAQDSNYNVLKETIEITYNAKAVVLQGEQVKRQGEFVFVKLRQFEELGAEIGWDEATKTATFIVGETKVEVVIGSLTAKVNGEAVKMPVAPFIANDRTYVPTRFIAEQLGWNVHWAAGDVITITLP